MATIRDISKLSGYSISTVSHALNGRGRVSKETRKKIIAVAQEENYIPNTKAISLSIGKSHSLGIIIPYTEPNTYYDKLINSIISECFANDYRPIFLATHFDKKIEDGYLKLLASKEFDALVITAAANDYSHIEKYLQYGPIISCEYTGNNAVPFVTLDRKKAYLDIIEKYQKMNLEQFGCTFSRTPSSSIGAKLVYSVFEDNVTNFSLKNTFSNTKNFQDGVNAANYFIKNFPDIECIFANSDEIAAGIINRYKEVTPIYIPLIIGQNNEPWSIALNFSSIDFRIEELGSLSVKNALSKKSKDIYIESFYFER